MRDEVWMILCFHSSLVYPDKRTETVEGVFLRRVEAETMERWNAGDARRFMQGVGLFAAIWLIVGGAASANADPTPKPWPPQFHAQMYQNQTGKLSMIDLWYDFPNGRNLNLIQKQLGAVTHDVEYTNGTSYYFDLEAGTCKEVHFPVGILPPDWLSDATYAGVQEIDTFKCNVWEKADFIRYYEDIDTKRPVSWYFINSGMDLHIMTFEEGNVLEDQKWQAPVYCFQKTALTASEDEDQTRKGLLSKTSFGGRKELYPQSVCHIVMCLHSVSLKMLPRNSYEFDNHSENRTVVI